MSNIDKLYNELKSIGFPDINEYTNDFDFYSEIKKKEKSIFNLYNEIILRWEPFLERRIVAIGLLSVSKKKYDGSRIIPEIFEKSNDMDKWQILNMLIKNPPLHIENWTIKTYLSKNYSYKQAGLLPLLIIKILSRDEARIILKKGFDHQFRVTPEALGKVGVLEDIPFLESKLKLNYDATHVTKDLLNAIEKIKKNNKNKYKP